MSLIEITKPRIIEDFIGCRVIGTGPNLACQSGVWIVAGTGSPTVDNTQNASGSPGILRLGTSTTSGDSCTVTYATPVQIEDVAAIHFRCRFHASTSNLSVNIGIGQSTGVGLGTAGLCFKYETTIDTHWHAEESQASSFDRADLGAVQSVGVWNSFLLEVGSTGASHGQPLAQRFDASMASLAVGGMPGTNFPAGGGALNLVMRLDTWANASAFVDIDCIDVIMKPTTRGTLPGSWL